jgi:uncharacterized membrane protein
MLHNPDIFYLSRALHIVGVVFWIGGVAFVTCILIPALKEFTQENNKMQLFEKLEGKFAKQAKITTLLTGLSGFYMLEFMQGWSRYSSLDYWWLHLMTMVWIVFTLVLFVFEPWFLHRWFLNAAMLNSVKTFKVLHYMHIILLSISIMAIVGALLGSHGYL